MLKIRVALLWLVVASLLSLGAGALLPSPVGAAESSAPVRYDRFDVDYVIAANGEFRVTEHQAVNFLSGTFKRASRNIGLANTQQIKDVTVTGDGQAYTQSQNSSQTANTFTTTSNSSTLTIEWYFPQTVGPHVRNFEISYTVVGGLRIYSDLDVLDWVALRQDLPASAVASTVTVQLPKDIDKSQFRLDSQGATARQEVVDGRTARFVTNGVPRGDGLAIKVSFPHGLVSASPPPWQAAFDQQTAKQEREQGIRDLANLLLALLGFLVLLGGGIFLFILWYTRGRDPHVGLVADYLREPPSDLSPGVMGTLIDERADLHDVLGTLTDLGRKGIIQMTEVPPAEGSWGRSDFMIERRDTTIPVTKLEQAVLDTILPNGAIRMRLSEVKGGITASLARFNDALYDEVVDRGYFKVSPERTRQRYRSAGKWLAILAVVVCLVAFFIAGSTLGGLIFPAIGLVIIALALRGLARAMPVKTRLGAEEAAKWNAFRRYLANLEKYENLEEAKGRFEQYLPYATAFGLDQSFIQKFASVATPVPQWFGGGGFGGPVIINPGGGYYGGGHHHGGGYYGPGQMGGGGGGGDHGGGGGWGVPSLDDLSNRGGGGLSSMSEGLAGMLSSAASVFGGGGGGSDSGWSGGGGGFDFGGGGGGGDSGGGGGGDFG
ncbi:MAG: DUF2207 domain-containing protein [Chloroflexia bacterium]